MGFDILGIIIGLKVMKISKVSCLRDSGYGYIYNVLLKLEYYLKLVFLDK